MMSPLRFGAASSSLRAKPDSKSAATAKPTKTPPNAALWMNTKTNWKLVYPDGKSNPGTEAKLDSPPAKASRNTSGKMIAGRMSAGFLDVTSRLRRATAAETWTKAAITCAPSASAATRPPP